MSDDERPDPRVAEALKVKKSVAAGFMKRANVTGVGVGSRIVGGKRTDEICVRVYVNKKRPKEELSADELLPREVEGVRVDVIEATFETQAIADHRRRHNPMEGGISVGNFSLGGSGTMGTSVFDNVTGMDLILSNWHVLCGRLDCSVGETVIQPGTGGGDTGVVGDVVAELFREALTSQVDGAVALLTGHRFLLKSNFDLGRVNGTRTAAVGMTVRKSGRTTGVTEGTVGDVDADIEVIGYPGGTRTFTGQIVVDADDGGPISQRGDSGSVWMDRSNRVVGLHFAGNRDGTYADANPIQAVLRALNVNFGRGVTMHDFVAITENVLH